MNLPNKLTLFRIFLIPIYMVLMLAPIITDDFICRIVCASIFVVASLTDMLDGKIARKYGLVTDFGKFLDPLADKFMVIGAMLCIFYANSVAGNTAISTVYFFALVVVIFRELAVTSIRLVASSSSGVVIAANILGKLKTVTQIVAVCAAIIEPIIYNLCGLEGWVVTYPPMTMVMTVAMIYLTIHSGINYIVGAWKYLDPQK